MMLLGLVMIGLGFHLYTGRAEVARLGRAVYIIFVGIILFVASFDEVPEIATLIFCLFLILTFTQAILFALTYRLERDTKRDKGTEP